MHNSGSSLRTHGCDWCGGCFLLPGGCGPPRAPSRPATSSACSRLQEIALVDPSTLSHDAAAGNDSGNAGTTGRPLDRHLSGSSLGGTASAAGSQAATPTAGGELGWPQLPPVATRPRSPLAAEAVGQGAGGDAPQHCVLLRAGGIMSKLDMQEGSEVLLSDAIECFWLPVAPVASSGSRSGAPAGGSTGGSGGVSRASSFAGPGGGGGGANGAPGGSLSASSSAAGMARQTSDHEFGAATASRLASELSDGGAAGGAAAAGAAGRAAAPPRVEMPWWTYGARGMQVRRAAGALSSGACGPAACMRCRAAAGARCGMLALAVTPPRRPPPAVPAPTSSPHPRRPCTPPPPHPRRQLWFPTSLSEPLTPSTRAVASPTATGLAAAAAAAATNSTDPELEFDREVYPIGVSLAEVSIIGERSLCWLAGWLAGGLVG